MKTQYFITCIKTLKISIGILILFFVMNIRGQVQQPNDTIGYFKGKIRLKNPTTILSAYTYDPITDRYIYTNKVGGFNINYPVILTPKEYRELVTRESIRKYFKEKSDAIEGVKAGSELAKRDLLPRFYVNNNIFETIFGSNTIDVKPTGTVEMDLGARYTKQDNPSFSPRNRSQTSFDFNQRINLSVMGKVGTRLNVNINYDTQSTFAFQNLIKLEYAPEEDNILQKLEVGNVNMPLNSSLIKGAQTLFGVKAQLQFGKTTLTGVFSEQNSQTRSVAAQGGATVQEFDLFALDYDADRHFFFSQFFRNKYDVTLRKYPLIDSRVQITRVEVWVTNRSTRVSATENNLRNIIAIQDLGESELNGFSTNEVVVLNNPTGMFLNPPDSPSDNGNNKYDPKKIGQIGAFLKNEIREVVTTNNNAFSLPPGATATEGRDYSKLENARKLTANEYTFHPQLGYLSLQQRLANDEVLGIAYEYTMGDKVFQVGEFGNGGVESTVIGGQTQTTPQTVATQSLVVKMLKSSLANVQAPIWNLMMKNIYQVAPGGQLERDDFRFNIVYSEPSPVNYINIVSPLPQPQDLVTATPLLKVFNLDRLNFTNDPQDGGDGFFDYIPGITVDTQNGRIIFTTIEPFGKHLFNKLRSSPSENYKGNPDNATDYNVNQKKFVFKTMYTSTQAGALQNSEKNKFQLRGRYKSTGGDGIAIGAFNVPRGSVVVTANGRVLVEGADYTVNYQLGRVQITDPALKASNTPIQISLENNSVFGQQTRRFMGINVEHKFSDKFLLGGTLLKLSERPFTQKSSFGQESVNNTIFGFNTNYSSEIPFFTRIVNKLPNIDTDVPSNLSLRAEVAFLKPDSPAADRFEGESTIYVDDFEGSQTTIDMKSPLAWSLASVPLWKSGSNYSSFGLQDGIEPPFSLNDGFKRAKLAWHTVDPVFYSTQKPSGITEEDMSKDDVRRVFIKEIFPQTDIADGQTAVINTLDVSYYPADRGPYNYSNVASGNVLQNPKDNFGGIMRSVNSTNFEQANVEYIQFWVLDPYRNNQIAPSNTGKVFFNLGQISEDVLRDGRKQYENGLPAAGTNQSSASTIWGSVPVSQSLIYAFDTNEANRNVQDVGLDGLNDISETRSVPAPYNGLQDPSADNYKFYLNETGSVLNRYKNYNGFEGNSPVTVTDNNRGNSTLPDAEDINRDNTMNTINAYYQYDVDIKPNMTIGDKYVTDIREASVENPAGGANIPSRWIQFKIPIDQGQNQVKFGGIQDFRSIQFMRMFLTGFSQDITLRFGTLDLVRGEWRRFTNTLAPSNLVPIPTSDTGFDVLSVNVQENSNRVPIKYIVPPGVQREQLFNNNTVINQNEQSLSLVISKAGLEAGDARAVFKNVSVDMRQFNKLKMFLHAEALENDTDSGRLKDNEMSGFIRFGNDFTQNYYQVERPLKTTFWGDSSTAEKVWPSENNVEIELALLTQLKILANQNPAAADVDGVYSKFDYELDSSIAQSPNSMKLSIRGNPNFGLVRTLMIGVRNNTLNGKDPNGLAFSKRNIRGEVWFNELRLAGMDNKGGWAAIASLDTNFADFATITASGKISTVGFGALEDGPNERSRNATQQYNIITNLNLGKLLPKKWGINLPFNYGVGEEIITPEFDPFNQDIRLKQLIDVTSDQAEKDNIRDRAISYTKTQSINFIGVKKERAAEQKQRVYDPENLTLSYSYNETNKHDFEIQSYRDQQIRTSVDYAFSFQSKPIEPFKNIKLLKKTDYFKPISDFNFNYLPSNINFSTTVLRQYNRQQFRQVDVAGIGLSPLFRRNFQFNYQYGFNYALTKSLKLNYTASTNNIVRNYLDQNGKSIDEFALFDDYFNVGETNQHNQQLTAIYDLPINKIPLLSFVKSTYTYTGDFSWQRATDALSMFEDANGNVFNLGNTIQNNSSHRINSALNMDLLYKYLGLVKGGSKPKGAKLPKSGPPKPGEKIVNARATVQREANIFLDGLIGFVTAVKNVQLNFTRTAGTVLPGYTQGLGFFGTTKPSLGFVFGDQADVRYEAAKNGYLTNYPEFNQNFTRVSTQIIDFTANVDLFPDFKIDLIANRTSADNFSEQFDVSNGQYNSRAPYSFGNFAISTVLIKTAFSTSDEVNSDAFDNFKNNRIIVADRLASQYYTGGIPRYGDSNNPIPVDITDPRYKIFTANAGYPIGFGKNSQQVLLPSFLAAYTGGDAGGVSLNALRNIPIPNWTVKYTGLMRYGFFKENFKRFSIQHAYRSTYTINSLRSNFEFDKNPAGFDTGGNFHSRNLISNVNLVEQFNPLVKVDFQLQNSLSMNAEIKRDRSLSMSFDNNLLTELKGQEYVVGMGYRIKNVTFNSVYADSPTGIINSDIDLKLDVSYRNSQTIVRNLDYNNNQLSGGQNLWSIRLNAAYTFSKNLTAIFYYDHSFTKAVISTAFPITNIRSGFTLKYNFGN